MDSKSLRVQQIAAIFDVPLGKRRGESFEVALPELTDNWRIGVIVGPSGSGKSSVYTAQSGQAPCIGGG